VLEQQVGEVGCHAFEELLAGDVFGLHRLSLAAGHKHSSLVLLSGWY